MHRTLRCYDYVPVPYQAVRDALRRDALAIFQRATQSAGARAGDVVAHLGAKVGPFEVGVDAKIEIRDVAEEVTTLGDRITRIRLGWTAAQRAGLFPAMDAVLGVYPLSAHETQIDLDGRYEPPLGPVGVALDALLGQRIAEATMLRFLADVKALLQRELGGERPAAP